MLQDGQSSETVGVDVVMVYIGKDVTKWDWGANKQGLSKQKFGK